MHILWIPNVIRYCSNVRTLGIVTVVLGDPLVGLNCFKRLQSSSVNIFQLHFDYQARWIILGKWSWVDPYPFIIQMDWLNKKVLTDYRRHWQSTLYIQFTLESVQGLNFKLVIQFKVQLWKMEFNTFSYLLINRDKKDGKILKALFSYS